MSRKPRNTALFAFLLLLGVSAFAQDRSLWRTANDIREGTRGSIVGTVVDTDETRNRLTIELDQDRYARVSIEGDSVATTYNGFGGVINGKPEIFTGSAGFSNVREGDRIEVRGTGRGTGIVVADSVTLLGRSVAASQVGVGTTRDPSSISTPPTNTTNATATARRNRVEGVVQSVNTSESRLVIQTTAPRLITIRGTRTTPVFYRNEVYRIGNIEVGDLIAVEPETADAAADDVRARSIEVLESVQDRRSTRETTRVQTMTGRVSRIDTTNDRIWITANREEVQVDLGNAFDSGNRRFRASDFRVGDQISVTGSYSGGRFTATSVNFAENVFSPPETRVEADDDDDDEDDSREYVTVSFTATVIESLQTSPTLVVRDTTGRTIELRITEDFAVRTKSGTYTTADRIRDGESVVVKAFRDEDGVHIAQTIRYR